MQKLQIKKMIFWVCGVILVSPLFGMADVDKGLSLEQSYQLALKRSEDLQIQEEQINQAEEKIKQANGSILPTINAVGAFLKQEQSANTSTSPSTQNTAKITLDQPLFRGLRDFAYIRQQKKNLESTEFLREQARIQLFSDVAQAYYQLLAFQEDVRILKKQMEVNQKRLIELRSFHKIGRARDSDVLALDANTAALEATTESVRVAKESAWSVFRFLTGVEDRPALEDQEPSPAPLKELSVYLEEAKKRPDLKALESSAFSLEEGVAVARGAHFPSIDLLGDYYFMRPGALEPVKWDVSLAVTFPIFQGGVVQSQVRQATSLHQQAELQFEKAKRQTMETVAQQYRQLELEISQEEKQKLASELAVKNYDAQVKDNRMGLVTNIDVLTALSNAQDSLRLTNRIKFQIKTDYFKLLASTTERPIKQ